MKVNMYKIYKLYWRNKSHFPLYLSTPLHYTFFMSKSCPICTQNLSPSSCRASLETLKTPNLLSLKAGCARIRRILQSLITRQLKALFKDKFREDTNFAGESKLPPRSWQKRFEGVWSLLQLDNKLEIRISLKASDNEGLKASGTSQVIEKRIGQDCSVDEDLGQKEVEIT